MMISTKQQQHWEVVIKGPLEKVFDLVNVAALWPHWHPVTRAVGGVTDIPFQKGDMIYEHVRTPNGPYEFQWEIVEHDRPHRAKMTAQDGTSITYTFEEKADGIQFRRAVELGPEGKFPFPNWFQWETEGPAAANLKALVEKIIWKMEKGPQIKVPYRQP
jgi:uncharacterized protein YndB with AHSA1/START domain